MLQEKLARTNPYIPDPDEVIPPYTNVGDWEPRLIVNPEYERLYEEFERKQRNPNYQGRWEPKMIKSPLSSGKNNGKLAEPVTALGITIEIVTPGVLFDNIFLDTEDLGTVEHTEQMLH